MGTMTKQLSILAIFAAILLAALAASPVGAAGKSQEGTQATHIIVFNSGVDAQSAAGSLASAHGLTVNNVYSHALSGMAAVVLLATSKSGTLLLKRDQGEMAVFWDSRSRRL